MTKTIPIIILNWNGAEDTLLCVEHILKQSYTSFFIHLVDNSSSENDKKLLKDSLANNPKIKLHFNSENLGFVRAHNEVIESEKLLKKHDFIALLNNDAFADKNWLKSLVESARSANLDMVSSKMVNNQVKNLIDNTGHFMLNTGEVMPWGFGENIEQHTCTRKNMGACAGAALYSTNMLQNIGLFDLYFNTGYEDAELGVRAFVTGHKLMYEPKAIVHHKMSASINKVRNEDYMVYIQKSIYYAYLKLMPTPVILLNIGIIFLRTLLLLMLFLVFMRPTYVRIHSKAIKQLFKEDWSALKKARTEFHNSNTVVSSFEVIAGQRFFLWDNIKRFYVYFIKGTPTVFEKHVSS